MAFALRHPISIFVVLLATLATAVVVFGFARSQYHPRYESKMIDFAKVDYYSPTHVREAFAAKGVRLHISSRFNGIVMLTNASEPVQADALQVAVAPRTGKGSFGPKLEPYDERFGNVLVTYGGQDKQMLGRVEAAVSALR